MGGPPAVKRAATLHGGCEAGQSWRRRHGTWCRAARNQSRRAQFRGSGVVQGPAPLTQPNMAEASSPLIKPDHNAWRAARAGRAAVLIDAGQYFGAVREALLNARSTAFIIGWDLDSRTRLVGEDCRADDGFPEGFIEFLTALVKRRPQLRVHVLVWDYSILYASERELF